MASHKPKSRIDIPEWLVKFTDPVSQGLLKPHSPKIKTEGLWVWISALNSCQNQMGICLTVSTRRASTPRSNQSLIADFI